MALYITGIQGTGTENDPYRPDGIEIGDTFSCSSIRTLNGVPADEWLLLETGKNMPQGIADRLPDIPGHADSVVIAALDLALSNKGHQAEGPAYESAVNKILSSY